MKRPHIHIKYDMPGAFLLLLAMSIVNLLFMHYTIILTCQPEVPLDGTSWIDNLSSSMLDATIVYLLMFLATWGRARPAAATAFAVTLLWAFVNIVYSRFFHAYLTLSAIGQGSSMLDPIVIKSTLQGIRWTDGYFLIAPAVFAALYRRHRQATATAKATATTLLLFTTVLWGFDLLAHGIFCLSRPTFRYASYYFQRLDARHISEHGALCEPTVATFHRGSLRILTSEAFNMLKGDIALTDDQQTVIARLANQSRTSMVVQRDSLPQIERVIFIIVESYMAFTSDLKVDGQEITPHLNALRHDSATYYNGHMQPNITVGESADGQYIYMTGLLPLRSVITVSKARSKELPGLPKALSQQGMEARMVIPTSPNMWNQSAMCQRYGFDRLYSCNDYQAGELSALNDQQVFELAAAMDKQAPRKSLSVILTMSMHQPYTEAVDPSFVLHDKQLSAELKNYLNACHYTDKQIGRYLQQLKADGLYDKSLIVITADHHVHSTSFGPGITDDLPLYIVNGNIDNRTAWHGTCNQIDVYTTLLDVLGMHPAWCGLGHSLLSPSYRNSLDADKWDASEWMLLSNYFNRQAPASTPFIAHGGGSIDGKNYTNSREAILHALEQGYQHVELDLQLTADSQLVCMHSMKDFQQMTGLTGDTLTAAKFKEQRLYGRYTPVTAADVVALMGSHPFRLVTDKISDPRLIDRYFHTVKDRVMVEAFSIDDYRQLKALGYTPMLSLYHDGIKRQYLSSCYQAREKIAWITTSVKSMADFKNIRLLKRLFGVKVAVFTTLPPNVVKEQLGDAIDLLYTDNKDEYTH